MHTTLNENSRSLAEPSVEPGIAFRGDAVFRAADPPRRDRLTHLATRATLDALELHTTPDDDTDTS